MKLADQHFFDSMRSFKHLIKSGRYAKFTHLQSRVIVKELPIFNTSSILNLDQSIAIPHQMPGRGHDDGPQS